MSTSLDLDLSLLEGLSVSPPCEHHQHPDKPQWHADGNEHYIKVRWDCGHGDPNQIFVVCGKWLLTEAPVRCSQCPNTKRVRDGVTDLGLVSEYH